MNDLMTRARTLATAALTWILIAGAVLTAVAQALTSAAVDNAIDLPWLNDLVGWCTVAAGALATVAAVVRRVTEVIPEQRGLIPVDRPIPSKFPPPAPGTNPLTSEV
jgi:hypothetical protein